MRKKNLSALPALPLANLSSNLPSLGEGNRTQQSILPVIIWDQKLHPKGESDRARRYVNYNSKKRFKERKQVEV